MDAGLRSVRLAVILLVGCFLDRASDMGVRASAIMRKEFRLILACPTGRNKFTRLIEFVVRTGFEARVLRFRIVPAGEV